MTVFAAVAAAVTIAALVNLFLNKRRSPVSRVQRFRAGLQGVADAPGDAKSKDSLYCELCKQLVDDPGLAREVAQDAFSTQERIASSIEAHLRSTDIHLPIKRRPQTKDQARIASKFAKETKRGATSAFYKVLSDFIALRIAAEEVELIDKAHSEVEAFFKGVGATIIQSGELPNKLSLRIIVVLEGRAIEVQVVHPAAGIMFADNSTTLGHQTGHIGEGCEAPNFFKAVDDKTPLSFYNALSKAIIDKSPNPALPALLRLTYTSKGWPEEKVNVELLRYALQFADADT